MGLAERRAARQPLEVTYGPEEGAQPRAPGGLRDQRGDRGLALVDRRGIEERPEKPVTEEPRPHRRHRPVEHAEERRASVPAAALEELEGLDRRRVEDHGVHRREPREVPEVTERGALGGPEVGQGEGRGLHPRGHVTDAEPV